MTNREEQQPARVRISYVASTQSKSVSHPSVRGIMRRNVHLISTTVGHLSLCGEGPECFRLSAVSSIRSLLDHTSEHSQETADGFSACLSVPLGFIVQYC